MSSGTNQSTVLSDAELRVITVKTEAGDNVKYSGNPAELPGARYETMKAMRRAGAFTLLVEHGAARLKNGTIAVDDVNNIPFVQKSHVQAVVCLALGLSPGAAAADSAASLKRAAELAAEADDFGLSGICEHFSALSREFRL